MPTVKMLIRDGAKFDIRQQVIDAIQQAHWSSRVMCMHPHENSAKIIP